MYSILPINELIKSIGATLEGTYTLPERQQVAFLLLEKVLGISKKDQMLNAEISLKRDQAKLINDSVARLLKNEPVQYVLGSASFYGRDFKVGPEVLIPRGETEELVHWVLKDIQKPFAKILDVGTGSGCISITLALELNTSRLYALDLSAEALSVARKNSRLLKAPVNFIHADILDETPDIKDLDVIISNPPYVPQTDWQDLQPQVKTYEPAKALVVPHDDPLKFYKRLAVISPLLLTSGGTLYLEIYHTQGPAIKDLFKGSPWSQVQLKTDLHGKDRFVKATLE